MVRRNEKAFRKDEDKERPACSKTLDEVIESITQKSGLQIKDVRKPALDRFWVDRETYNYALFYLREYQEELEKCCNTCDCFEVGCYCKLHSIFIRSDFVCRDWESAA